MTTSWLHLHRAGWTKTQQDHLLNENFRAVASHGSSFSSVLDAVHKSKTSLTLPVVIQGSWHTTIIRIYNVVCRVECLCVMHIVRVRMCLCMQCVTQWVFWVCWRCLPKLQRAWRFSTNPASLEGLLIPTAQFSRAACLLLCQKERMREEQVYRLCVHLFCISVSCSEINRLASPERLHANALATTKFHAASSPPLSPSLSFSIILPYIVPPLLSHSLHLAAALHCWRQQPGSPLYFWEPQIDTSR